MDQIGILVQQARENAGKDRRGAIAQLQRLALEEISGKEAVTALINLWRENFAVPGDLAPFAATVLENWKRIYECVKPFQQEIVKVEWVMDYEYAPVSSEAESLIGLLGYFPGEDIGHSLREVLHQLTDPSLRMVAVLSLVRRGDSVTPEEIEPVAASHLARIYLWEQLQDLGMESLMPARWASPEELAASDLSRWLSHPHELNAYPEEIELMETYALPEEEEGPDANIYLFRFREFPKPWEPGEGWMAGLAGPYRDGRRVGSPWSELREWDSMSPDEHVGMLYYRNRGGHCETRDNESKCS